MYYAYYYCNKMTKTYDVPNSVTMLAYAYYYCNALNCSINIGTGVTNMNNAFRNCQSMNRVYINIFANSITNAGMRNAFNTVNTSTKYIKVYNGTTTAKAVNNSYSGASSYGWSISNL